MIIYDLIKYGGHIPFVNETQAFIYFFAEIISLLFSVMYLHQIFYLILGTCHHTKIKIKKEVVNHKIGIVISARNESSVIKNLIDSIHANDYPADLVNIFVIADNCTDNTAQIARENGCIVFERFNTEKVGKGYALNYLFEQLHAENSEYADLVPDAYIVLDADNVIKKNYITEMNKAYSQGYEMVTSYRNSKNIGKNWITAGYGYWFLHEARHLNNPRMMLHTSCAISGTGFLISTKVVKEHNNWEFFTLTEDIQCSTAYALSGKKVAYCGTAELYDEQPETFKQSWKQRERWAKGFYQVFGKYGGKLITGMFHNFACWDIFTTIMPALFTTLLSLIVLPTTSIVALCLGDAASAWIAIDRLFGGFGALCVLMWIFASCVCITEWKHILMPWYKKLFYVLTFPLFMLTYLPISFVALFKKVEWKPIVHTANISIDNLGVKAEKSKNAEENVNVKAEKQVNVKNSKRAKKSKNVSKNAPEIKDLNVEDLVDVKNN